MKVRIKPRTNTVKNVFLALLLLFPVLTFASDKNGYYYVVALGKNDGSCSAYLAAREEGRKGDFSKQDAYFYWLAGYLTAYNRREPETYNIMGTTGMKTLQLWLDNYCKGNPRKLFAEATEALMDELDPIRAKQAPK